MASITISSILGVITQSFLNAFICFSAGFFIDADHIIDYVFNHRLKGFSFNRCYRACRQTARKSGPLQFKKIYIFFHSIEFTVLLLILGLYFKNFYILIAVLGLVLHLSLDYLGNKPPWKFYFLFWRIKNKFKAEHILPKRKEFI